jgi:hypothetical protein
MQILKEENAQGSAELLMVFGGIIVIAIIAALVYKNYLTGLGNATNNSTDTQNINNSLTNITNNFKNHTY